MHDEALTERARELFPRLARFKNFYLAGGTALALHIGHRLSVDFDLFTDEELPARLLAQLKRVFDDCRVTVTYSAPDQLNVSVDDIKVTFLQYGYPPVAELAEFQGVPLLSVQDIAATKAFAIGKRLAYKDYVDWYFLLKEGHVGLAGVIELSKRKYGGDFNDRLFVSQLVSLEDVSVQPIDFLRDPVSGADIQAELERHVKALRF